MDRQKRMEGNRWKERDNERGAQGLTQSEKQESQRGWAQHMLEQKKHMAPDRAGGCCLDQRQKKTDWRKGMHMLKEENPRAVEGLRAGGAAT